MGQLGQPLKRQNFPNLERTQTKKARSEKAEQ
jgi:hypothetical protein